MKTRGGVEVPYHGDIIGKFGIDDFRWHITAFFAKAKSK